MGSLLEEFKCETCKTVKDYVYTCRNNHLTCVTCAKNKNNICKCKAVLSQRSENPVCRQLDGCTWSFPHADMNNHLLECRYRPYRCIGVTLGAWRCNWQGFQTTLEDHLVNDASHHGQVFEHFQDSSVIFNDSETLHSINLVNAFARRFVFYYTTNPQKEVVYFIIYLMGRKDEAERYFIDFKIKSPDENLRKIKIIENCYSDSENITAIMQAEKCIVLTFKTIKNHLCDDRIHFRFVIKKKESISMPINQSTGVVQPNNRTGVHPKQRNTSTSSSPFQYQIADMRSLPRRSRTESRSQSSRK